MSSVCLLSGYGFEPCCSNLKRGKAKLGHAGFVKLTYKTMVLSKRNHYSTARLNCSASEQPVVVYDFTVYLRILYLLNGCGIDFDWDNITT